MKQQNKLKNIWGWVERKREGERRVGGAVHPGVAQQSLYVDPRANVQPFTPLYISIFDKKVPLFVYSLTQPRPQGFSLKNAHFFRDKPWGRGWV